MYLKKKDYPRNLLDPKKFLKFKNKYFGEEKYDVGDAVNFDN